MAEIKQSDGRAIVSYMPRDYDSLLKAMRDMIPYTLPEWKDAQAEADFGNVLLQLFAHMGDILSYHLDRVANEAFLGTAQTRRSIIQHLRLIGYKLSTAAPAAARLTLTFPATATGTVTIKKGDAFATKSQKGKPSVRFEYTSDTPRTINVAIEKVVTDLLVEEGKLVQDEIVGMGDGKPNQRFMLAHAGLILRAFGQGALINRDFTLTSDLGGVRRGWTLQEDLAFNRPGQNDYAIEIDEFERATLLFGDGALGAVPQAGEVFTATYRTGGGIKGNVGEDAIQTITNAPALALLGAKVTNPSPATGGAERESIEHAVLHAPSVFRSLKRAVTADDYVALALNFKGVGKVRARATSWNTVTLYVAPQGGGNVSDVLEANLLAYFEDKRPLSTLVEIADVDYVSIFVTAEVGVDSYYARADVTEQIKARAGGLLAFERVNFADNIFLSKFYEAIEAIPGVAYVTISEFRRDPPPLPSTSDEPGRIKLQENEIPTAPQSDDYKDGIQVIVREGGY